MKKKTSIILCSLIIGLLVTTVRTDASEILLSQEEMVANIGETVDLDVTGTDKIPVWTSYNANIAKVNSEGEVTALRKGKTTIKVRVGNISKTCSVNVMSSSVKLNKSSAKLYVGGTTGNTIKLKATTSGTNNNVQWSSSDESVAKVDAAGNVTAVNSGVATITVSANNKEASCVVKVEDSSITLNATSLELGTKGKGKSTTLKATVVGAKKTVKWESSDKNVATVSNGKLTGKNEGTATITATANGITTSCDVKVVQGISDKCKILSDQSETVIEESEVILDCTGSNKTYQLNSRIVGSSLSGKWNTSDKSVVTVKNGKLTAKKAGSATVTLTANEMADSVNVVVKDIDPKVTLNQSEYTLYTIKGNTVTLKAGVVGSNKVVTWNTSDASVATVKNGKVTAVGEGEAIITATANGVKAECNISVKETAVNLARKSITLSAGRTDVIPVDIIGANQTVKWTSTNTKVVTVKNGIITAKKNGEADIIVTANKVTAMCHIIVGDCEHDYAGKVTKEPTCYTVGEMTYTCTKCGDAYTEIIAVTAHNHKEVVTEPTCTEEGYTTHVCDVCGDSYVDNYVEATGHDWGEWTTVKEATETEDGERVRNCKKCDEEEREATHVHSYTSKVIEPTCTEQGYTEHKCSICDDVYYDNYVDASGHSYDDGQIIKEATCKEYGIRKCTCKECGHYYTEPIDLGEHKYEVNEVFKPECEFYGYTEYKCSVCGKTYDDDYVDPLGHDYKEEMLVEATCKEDGIKKYTCKVCGYYYDINIGRGKCKLEFVKVNEPDCVNVGCTVYKCSVCGKTYSKNVVHSLGHDYKLVGTIQPTCTQLGRENYECSRCGCSDYKIISSYGGHNYEETILQPTCTEKGYTDHKCSVCGDSYKDNYVDALGHEKNEVISVVEASKAGKGYTEYSCTRCDGTFHDDFTYYQPSVEQILAEIEEIKKEYPDGTLWDENTEYTSLRTGITFDACLGFATMLDERIFGIETCEYILDDYTKIRIGDRIRYTNDKGTGHICMVTEVGEDYVLTANGNVAGYVVYDRMITKEFLESHEFSIRTHFQD